MAATVSYNGSSPWGTNTPYVNVSTQPLNYGNKWGNVTKISIVGSAAESIVGNLETFKDNLITTFATSKGTFSVNGTTFSNAYVDSLSIPNQRFKGKLDYTINLTNYDFDGTDILDPSEDVVANVEENQKVSITHTASARGLNGAAGFSAARTWVQARLAITPTWHSAITTTKTPVLLEETESIDRTKSSYSAVKKYVVDEIGYDSGSGISKRYNVSITDSLNGDFQIVEVVGEFSGGASTSMSTIRSGMGSAASLKTIGESSSGLTLNPTPTDQAIDETPNEKKITLKCVFNNDTLFGSQDYYFDYSVSVSEDIVTGVTSVSVDGELITRGSIAERISSINAFLSANSPPTNYLHGFCNTAYSDITGAPYTLNTTPSSINVSKNENKGTLKLSATFSDEDSIAGYSEAEWSVDVTSSIPYIKYAPSATENGYWSFQDFGFLTRETVASNCNLVAHQESGTHTQLDIDTQNSNLTNSVHSAFQGTGTPYTVNEGRSEQDTENLGGSKQLQKSYESGSPIISM